MNKSANPGADIGSYIRQHVMPKGMTVTEAARRLGVSRPALSKLLNGRTTLSPQMVLRLEKTFGADVRGLLSLQAALEPERRRDQHRNVPVRTYVPGFLTITADQITDWAATKLAARELLPVLLRRLVYSTAQELRHVDFPGFDNAQRPGLDGQVEAGAATPWVPAGRSVWEISVAQRPQGKAEDDYQKRVSKLKPVQRADCTFVFVTARNWPAKEEWVSSKKALREWKAVRVYDASDLEQWLETTVEPRIWLSEKIAGKVAAGFRTIEACWNEWAAGSEPEMTPAIFAPSITSYRRAFRKWLDSPPNRPLTVVADSREEAVAFIACFLRQENLPASASGSAVLFESADTLRRLAASTSPFIAVVCSEETRSRIGDVYRRRHCIEVHPRNAVDRTPDIVAELLGRAAFEEALTDMGIGREHFDRLARESGRSPTVLRRRLSEVMAIRTPPWAGKAETARMLLPMALVGAWHAGSKADCEVLEALADRSYKEVESTFTQLHIYDDRPVWRVGQHYGVVSKLDALYAIKMFVIRQDIVEFLELAEYVLSESDPAFELSSSERWKAGFFGKVREHSVALRSGVRETLVLLAIHANNLFSDRLGLKVEEQISTLVKRLLTPFTNDKLLSQNHDVPDYAEAAPDAFLAILQQDLQRQEPVLRTLLQPAQGSMFLDSPARTGMLWALERLAWQKEYLSRVVLVLADLSRTRIDDNWDNKPIKSLAAIFHSWLPQTAASVKERIIVLKVLCDRFPDIGWQICIQQFDYKSQIGEMSARPRWRNDAAGGGKPKNSRERSQFQCAAFDLAVAWPTHDVETLGDLVESLPWMGVEQQLVVWNLIDAWTLTELDDTAKAALRERIGRAVFTHLGRVSGVSAVAGGRVRKIYERLAAERPSRTPCLDIWQFCSPIFD